MKRTSSQLDTPPPPASPASRDGGLVAYDLLLAGFVAILLISSVASTKIVQLGPLSFDGGTLLFPLSYIFGDVLTEVYGFARARRAIWAGFGAAALLASTLAMVCWLPSAPSWTNQAAFAAILGQTPRIVLASLIAFSLGGLTNAWVMSRMKVRTEGRALWARTITSTIIGEGVDTVLFVLIAFLGVLDVRLLLAVILSNYVFKVGVEALATPFTYAGVNVLKRLEGVDHFDRQVRYDPFSLGAS